MTFLEYAVLLVLAVLAGIGWILRGATGTTDKRNSYSNEQEG